ncbi:MAG: hypothetical protein IVW53_12605 [Chloroflexi bacterium]|nr:hypothetical protein [Chloroflexota bacterium]
MRRLTTTSPRWLVWKNAESAFTGTGDIDAAAAASDWPTIEAEFCRWAMGHGVGPVVTCRHIPGGLNLIAVAPGHATFLEMGVKARRLWRGSTLFVLDDLMPMATLDPRGFRRLRPGAEGLFKLLLNGMRRDGHPNERALHEKNVRELLGVDPEGVRSAAGLFGPAAGAVIALARASAQGTWDRRAALAIEGWAVLRAFREPDVLAARVRFRVRGRHGCPVVEAILEGGRHIPGDLEAWLRRVAVDHVVHGSGPDGSLPDGSDGHTVR